MCVLLVCLKFRDWGRIDRAAREGGADARARTTNLASCRRRRTGRCPFFRSDGSMRSSICILPEAASSIALSFMAAPLSSQSSYAGGSANRNGWLHTFRNCIVDASPSPRHRPSPKQCRPRSRRATRPRVSPPPSASGRASTVARAHPALRASTAWPAHPRRPRPSRAPGAPAPPSTRTRRARPAACNSAAMCARATKCWRWRSARSARSGCSRRAAATTAPLARRRGRECSSRSWSAPRAPRRGSSPGSSPRDRPTASLNASAATTSGPRSPRVARSRPARCGWTTARRCSRSASCCLSRRSAASCSCGSLRPRCAAAPGRDAEDQGRQGAL